MKTTDKTPDAEPATASPAAPAAAAEKRTVEAWAEAKGYLPQFTGDGDTLVARPAPGMPTVVPVENLGPALRARRPKPNPKYYESGYAAARGLHAWPIGAEVTEAEFDAACHKAKHQPI